MKASRRARMQGWIHDHPWAATGFLLGVGTGILLCLPLLPYTLPDSSAQHIGSLLGAAIAVTGAMWVTTIRERRFRADLRLATVVIYEPFLHSLVGHAAVIVPLEGQILPLKPPELEALEQGKALSTVTRASFEDLKRAFGSRPNDIIVHRHLLGAMDRFIAYFNAEIERDKTRRVRQQQERQGPFNRPDLPKVTPQPVETEALVRAIDNSRAVMDTVGR